MRPFKRILVPTDFSEAASEAWRHAQMLAGPFKSRLHLLHVVALTYTYDPWGTQTAPIRMADLLAESEDIARRHLERLVPRSGPLAGDVVTATAIGVAVDQILEYIKLNRIDLVVMGTHGRGPVGHVLLGSVAERVVRRSPVPVLTVHGPGSTTAGRKGRRASRRR